MSPSKKTAKKTSAKKAAVKKAPKKAAVKKAPKKAAAKKAPKKAAAKKAPKKAAAKKAPKKAAAKKAPKKAAGKGKGPPNVAKTKQKPAPKGKLVPLSAIPHPKYGLKFECFECETRFYLMGKPEPVCPTCGADQRERPKVAKKEAAKTKRPAVRPMAPLLDDDEEVATPETTKQREPGDPDAMFDDAEVASVAEDTDEAPGPKPATEKGDDG
ncbi:MAG: FYDLN acid domain-containing protein [Myxococcota bacterium]